MSPDSNLPPNGTTLVYRITMLERELDKLEARWDTSFTDLRAQIGALRQDVAVFHTEFNAQVKTLENRLDQLEGSVNEDVKGLRKVLFGVGSAVLVAAITFAITSLAVYGAPG